MFEKIKMSKSIVQEHSQGTGYKTEDNVNWVIEFLPEVFKISYCIVASSNMCY